MQLPSKASEKPAGFYPAQYMRNPQPPVTAVRWLDNREQVNALFVGVSPRIAYVHAGADNTLVLSTGQVTATVRPGDWIVKRSDTDIYPVTADAFRDLYMPVTADNVPSAPIGEQHITFTDVSGDTLRINKGVLGHSIFLHATEVGGREVALLFSPADVRGIADTLNKLANEMEGIADGR